VSAYATLCYSWGHNSPPLKGHSPQFSAIVCCGQTAEWTKMPLGMDVGLGPARRLCVGWGPSYTPREKGHTHPHSIFGPCLLGPNGWVDEDATWYGSRPRHRPHCIRRDPRCPRKGHSSPLSFAHVYCGYGRPSHLPLSYCF